MRRDRVDRASIPRNAAESLAGRLRFDADLPGLLDADMAAYARAPDATAAALDLIERALAGEAPRATAACLEAARGRGLRISTELLALLHHFRVNAAVWMILQGEFDHMTVPGGAGANVMSDDPGGGGRVDAHVHFGGDRYRVPEGWLDVPEGSLTDAMAIAAVGRPLAEVAGHPALDGFGLVVEEVRHQDGHHDIIYGDHRTWVAAIDLEAPLMWPDPKASARIRRLHGEKSG